MGFKAPSVSLKIKGGMVAASDLIEDFSNRIDHYHADTRDFPAIKGPSHLSNSPFGLVRSLFAIWSIYGKTNAHCRATALEPPCGCQKLCGATSIS